MDEKTSKFETLVYAIVIFAITMAVLWLVSSVTEGMS